MATRKKRRAPARGRPKSSGVRINEDGSVDLAAGASVEEWVAAFEARTKSLLPTFELPDPHFKTTKPRFPAKVPASKASKSELLQPDLALALCIGPDEDTLEGLVDSLASDLEEMRWDGGSRSRHSALIPELEALVEEAGDPYEVSQKKLGILVKKHSAPVDSKRAEKFLDEIDRFSDE